MNSVEIVLYYDEPEFEALEEILAESGSSVETELNKHFRFLFEQLLPPEQQLAIKAQIEQERERERIEAEARKKFAVYHVHENGTDSYFTNEWFTSFNSAAYRYRLYSRDELDEMPETLADAFPESEAMTEEQYNLMQSARYDYPRILTIMDFDLDEGVAMVAMPGLERAMTFSLHDVSVAAFKANRSFSYSTIKSLDIFWEALSGKEIDTAPMLEHGSALQM